MTKYLGMYLYVLTLQSNSTLFLKILSNFSGLLRITLTYTLPLVQLIPFWLILAEIECTKTAHKPV